MIDFGLVVVRLLHYAAVTTLAGVSFFPLYAYAFAEPKELSRRRHAVLLSAGVGALLSGLLWFVFSVANMSGSLADVADHEVLWTVLNETTFGGVWLARMLLTVLILGVMAVRPFWMGMARRDLVTACLAAMLLASLAGTGHAQIEEGWMMVVHVVSDAAHVLAAGAWLGGLVPLGFILLDYARGDGEPIVDVDRVLLRFSSMGYVAVATLIVSGLVNSWFLVGSVSNLLKTPYGQILLGKLALFAAMLALAAANRFWLVPRMIETREDAGEPAVWLGRLRYHVLGEQFLGLMVLLAVSVLGTMRPAVGQ
ncbi:MULTISPECIES: copper homeostasis membrane protein CopD [unclassified Bradyrhizobium]|uniref:copper homeostasis membrane protein CopD n=1 Tax=unclassified Bradyrhizobium TaxID=2631580 RepID=UPI001FF765A1|nr:MULTISPECIES: copper homeostasis membrane protein CopD [unclassified Bradyrhizobium]MCK1711634.1 copper homeostasis membrane protein CopD [Bradyrhizobium sp. 143]MCK1730355.1 copper homeostasis membrane protein CopD [Bradyrhizobium sp. 142]